MVGNHSLPKKRGGGRSRARGVLLLACTLFGISLVMASPEPDDLTSLTLEELGALTISSAARHSVPLFQTPAAVTVLQSSDLLRYGHDSIAEALRMVPGVHVAQLNDFKPTVGVRGFNGITSTKLLVMVDGRNVYSPYYAGVEWEEANIPLEDIAQVEVVRGPGASLWGVNAVNGIVSITSKSARDTQGALVSVRTGTSEGLIGHVRYGGAAGPSTWFRVYARGAESTAGAHNTGGAGETELNDFRTGFRIDHDVDSALRLTLQGDYFYEDNRPNVFDPALGAVRTSMNTHERTSILGRANWRSLRGDELTVQLYADRAGDRSGGYPGLSGSTFSIAENGDNVDLDVSHHLKLGDRHDIVWGGGLRGTRLDLAVGSGITVQHPTGTDWRYNGFFQDELTLSPDRLKLTLGSKLEHHSSVGWQVLPSVRLAYTPDAQNTWWAAVSRAVRAPSRSERDVRLPIASIPANGFTPPMRIDLVGTNATREEVVTAYEAGWRFRPHPLLTFDASAYFNAYSQLRNLSTSTQFVPAGPYLQTDLTETNNLTASGHGLEIDVSWRATDAVRFGGGFTYERLRPHGTPVTPVIEGDFALPTVMANVRTAVVLPRDFEFSAAIYYVGHVSQVDVPGYVRCDAQLTWRPRPALELDIGVQNAFDNGHVEFDVPTSYSVTKVRANVFGRLQWRF